MSMIVSAKSQLLRVAVVFCALLASLIGQQKLVYALEGVECNEDSVCRSTDSGIPLRILTKPGANVFVNPSEDSGIAESGSKIPAFQIYYVRGLVDVTFDRETMESSGWFEVSTGVNEDTFGYIPAKYAVPWRQAIALAYTNPGTSERKPVLMFDNRRSLEEVLTEIDGGVLKGSQLHEGVDDKKPHAGIVSREPNVWVDINETFYLLPILEHEDVSYYSNPDDMRALRISALTSAAEGSPKQAKACDVTSETFDECQKKAAPEKPVGTLSMDVVFVVDMTGSMRPYIEAVRKSILSVARKLSEETSGGNVRFGLVGYRDSEEVNPGIEFAAKNFTPELLSADQLSELFSNPEVDAKGGGDIPEEVFAGIKTAIGSQWSEESKAARIIILIGDASAHGSTSQSSVTGLDEKALRDFTDAESIYVASIYVGNDADDRELARPQFETLAAGSEGNRAVSFLGSDSASLEASLRDVLLRLITFLGTGDFGSIVSQDTDAPKTGDAKTTNAILGAMRAAFVDYIGTGAAPPPSITAWVLDRDIVDYKDHAFHVKILVTKEDLENLIDFYGGLLSQFEGGKKSTSSFFGSVAAGSALTAYDLGLKNEQQLQESGKMPQVIKSLPYKSEILTLTLDEFKNASGDQRKKFEEDLREKVRYFEEALNNTDAWVEINQHSSDADRMFLMDLRWMP